MESYGRVNVNPGADLKFWGPIDLEGDGMLNITDGGHVAFMPLEEGKVHKIGGKGMEAEGDVDFAPGAQVEATTIHNTGTMSIGKKAGSTDEEPAKITVDKFEATSGSTTVNKGGVLETSADSTEPLKFTGATLGGDGGTVKGDVKLTESAVLAPGDPKNDVSVRSSLAIQGDLEMDATAEQQTAVLSTQADKIEVTGKAKLAGPIKIDIKYRPEEDASLPLLTAIGGIEGTYSSCNGCGAEDRITYTTATRHLTGDTAGTATSIAMLHMKGSGSTGPPKMTAVGEAHMFGGKGYNNNFFGGKVLTNKGVVSFAGETTFDGPLSSSGLLNISAEALAFFGPLEAGKQHMVGGLGMQSEGMLSVLPGADLSFSGPCTVDGEGMLNITDGGHVAFMPLEEGKGSVRVSVRAARL
jgi:hypothetical protein